MNCDLWQRVVVFIIKLILCSNEDAHVTSFDNVIDDIAGN